MHTYKIDIRKVDLENSFKPFTISGYNGIHIYPVYKEYFSKELFGDDGKSFLKTTEMNDGDILNRRGIVIWFNDFSLAVNYRNAFLHLCNLVKSDPDKYGFNKRSTDPFDSPIEVLKPDVENETSSNTIKLLKNSGGVYEVPVLINDVLKINFIFDSGASEVSLSPDVALTLLRTGTIRENDWLPSQVYRFADGSTAKSNRFMIRKFKIGNQLLTNIEASISNSIDAPMLVGQNVMQRLGSYMIDNENQMLIINVK